MSTFAQDLFLNVQTIGLEPVEATMEYAVNKYQCSIDPRVLDIFSTKGLTPAIQALNVTIQNKTVVFDIKNPNSISVSQLKDIIMRALIFDIRVNGARYIADKSTILGDKMMLRLWNSYIFELNFNPNLKVKCLADLYLNEWKVQILNQHIHGLIGACQNAIPLKAKYLSYCINNLQHNVTPEEIHNFIPIEYNIVTPRVVPNEPALDKLLLTDRENFISYMRVLDRTKDK